LRDEEYPAACCACSWGLRSVIPRGLPRGRSFLDVNDLISGETQTWILPENCTFAWYVSGDGIQACLDRSFDRCIIRISNTYD